MNFTSLKVPDLIPTEKYFEAYNIQTSQTNSWKEVKNDLNIDDMMGHIKKAIKEMDEAFTDSVSKDHPQNLMTCFEFRDR
jgi:hypothetical protein